MAQVTVCSEAAGSVHLVLQQIFFFHGGETLKEAIRSSDLSRRGISSLGRRELVTSGLLGLADGCHLKLAAVLLVCSLDETIPETLW